MIARDLVGVKPPEMHEFPVHQSRSKRCHLVYLATAYLMPHVAGCHVAAICYLVTSA